MLASRSRLSTFLFTLALAILARGEAKALVINEVFYHSQDLDDRPYEWIELYNENLDPLDLGGWSLCNGVSYEIPEGTWIEGFSYVVIASDPAAFRTRWTLPPEATLIGGWTGQLDNGGEKLELCHPGGVTILSLRYNDRGKWPVAADGTGHSLALRSPYSDVADADSWAASLEPGGTPGAWNGFAREPDAGPVSFNGMDGSGFITDWLVLGPYEGSSCNFPDGKTSLKADWLREADDDPNQSSQVWRDGQVVNTDYSRARSTGLHPNGGPRPTVRLYQSFSGTINLNDAVYPPDPNQVMAYAFTYVDNVTGASLPVTLGFASDDAVAVLVNGTDTFARDVCRAVGGDGEVQDRADTMLRPGKNLIAIKVFENGGGWSFRLRVEERGNRRAITSHRTIQVTTDVDAGLDFTGAGDPIIPIDGGGGPGPGGGDLPGVEPVVINEGFLRGGAERWIELYNRSASSVDLSGYFFTDDPSDLAKVRVADGVSITSGAWLLFSETDLGLDLSVDPVLRPRVFVALVKPDGRTVADAYNFEPRLDGFSEARIPDGDPELDDGADPTPGGANSTSPSRDIVINEVMYHPIDKDSDKEYLELYNRGAGPVDLTGWAITRGVDYAFAPGTTIAAGGYLVVARSPERIRAIYGLGAGEVVGPPADDPVARASFGALRDSGERITLQDELGRTADTVSFRDGGEWPRWPDGLGSSMELIDPEQDNRFGQAWDSSDDSAKAPVTSFSYTGRHGGGESELHVLLLSRGITVVDDISILSGGVSYVDRPLVEAGETWRYLKGTEAPPADWSSTGFNDAGWLSGPTGIGYGDGDDATVLTDMRNNYVTVFCRKAFTVADPSAIDELWLSVTVDDGFYAYLNGTQVASQNVSSPAWDANASSAGEPHLVERDLTSQRGLLRAGVNVLAVQVHNAGKTSSDLSFIPRLLDRTAVPGGGAEQVQNGTFETNTAGWMIEGTHWRSGRTTRDPITGRGSLKIIASGRGDNKVNRIETPNGAVGLGNLPTGADLEISFKARWVVGSQTILTHGYEHAMAKSHSLAVPEDLGTPGRINSVTLRQQSLSGGNLGPVFKDFEQTPAVPGDGEDVTIRVRVSDSDGVKPGTVRLRWTANTPSAIMAPIAMSPVGGPGGGGLYEATIPGQPMGTKVVFYCTAEDTAGQTGRYPIDVTRTTHPLLLDPSSAGVDDQRYFIYRHDVERPATPYHSYRFYVSQADEARIGSRRRLSNDLVPGSFVFEGDTIYQEAHTRFSGSPFARGGWGGSFRVALPRGNLLHGTIRKFNLDNHHSTGADGRERISHYLISKNQGGGAVPYSHLQMLVRWQINDAGSGIREHVWVPDVQFISLWFPNDDNGDFLEMDDRFVIDDNGGRRGNTNGELRYPPTSSRSDGDGANKENYRWFFGLRAKNGADDFSRFIDFCKVMDPNVTPSPAYDEQIWDVCNVEEFLRIWAVRLNTDDWDEWGGNRGKNCYFYRPSIDGRWNLLPWDMELTYGNPGGFGLPSSPSQAYNPGRFGEVHRMLNRPAIKRMYYGILAEMVTGPNRWFHSSALEPAMDRLGAIGMGRTDVGRPGGFIDQRAAHIANAIGSVTSPAVRVRITTRGGRDFSTDGLATVLSGTAPVEARVFTVLNGAQLDQYPATFPTLTTWNLGIRLVPGLNDLEVIALDSRGNPVGSDTIKVTSTATAWNAPAITGIAPVSALPGETVEITGTDFHNGVRVFFGAAESPAVVFDEGGARPDTIVAEVPAGSGSVDVIARNLDDQVSSGIAFTFLEPPPTFVRGDSNGDGAVDLSDPIRTLLWLFAGGSIDCEDAADADDNEVVQVSDAVYTLRFLFQGGPAPAGPYPRAGEDPAGDALGCTR